MCKFEKDVEKFGIMCYNEMHMEGNVTFLRNFGGVQMKLKMKLRGKLVCIILFPVLLLGIAVM